MATSINSPVMSNAIRVDIPALNEIVKALAKLDPSVLADLQSGTKRVVEGTSGWEIQQLEGTTWKRLEKFNIDAQSVDGFSASTSATANTIPVRDANGNIPGNITGNAATATKASSLSSTLSVDKGGTGSTSPEGARENIGAAPANHASTSGAFGASSATEFGHSKASTTTPKALGTASVGTETASFARGDHVHPVTTATGSVLGAVKLSDSTDSASGVNGGIAATPKAVSAVKAVAVSAQTTADAAAEAAAAAQATADSKLSSISAGTGISVSGSTVSLATGVVTAAAQGPTANANLGYGSTFTVPYIQYDAMGRVIAGASRTLKLPASDNSHCTYCTHCAHCSYCTHCGFCHCESAWCDSNNCNCGW